MEGGGWAAANQLRKEQAYAQQCLQPLHGLCQQLEAEMLSYTQEQEVRSQVCLHAACQQRTAAITDLTCSSLSAARDSAD